MGGGLPMASSSLPPSSHLLIQVTDTDADFFLLFAPHFNLKTQTNTKNTPFIPLQKELQGQMSGAKLAS